MDWSKKYDMSVVKGQEFAKRAIEVAVTGGHNLIIQGPEGYGKTLLCNVMHTIMPCTQKLTVLCLEHVRKLTQYETVRHFEEQQQTGKLDDQYVIELRTCRCGNTKDEYNICSCPSAAMVRQYSERLLPWFWDNAAVYVLVPSQPCHEFFSPKSETSDRVRGRVDKAIAFRNAYLNVPYLNDHLNAEQVAQVCQLTQQSKDLIQRVARVKGMSFKKIDQIIKVARTIADLDEEVSIKDIHVAEACQYQKGV